MSAFDYDRISLYVDGGMTPEEQKAFEEEMHKDEALKKEVELYLEVNTSLKIQLHPDEGETALRTTLEEMNDQYFSSGKQKARVIPFRPLNRWMAAAAAVLIIAAAGILFWSPWKKDLYKQYAYTEMPSVTERGEPGDSLLKEVTENFNNKKYSQTLSLFEAILKIDSQSVYIHYYYGIALQEDDQFEKSRTELTPLYTGHSLFKYEAAFYMALSYLKQKDKDSCREWLEKIPASAAVFNKAQQLLKNL